VVYEGSSRESDYSNNSEDYEEQYYDVRMSVLSLPRDIRNLRCTRNRPDQLFPTGTGPDQIVNLNPVTGPEPEPVHWIRSMHSGSELSTLDPI